jgi:hypothetical protein
MLASWWGFPLVMNSADVEEVRNWLMDTIRLIVDFPGKVDEHCDLSQRVRGVQSRGMLG